MSGNKTERVIMDPGKSDANGHEAAADPSGAELNKIRSILFGETYRELRDDYSQLRSEIEKRFATIENSLGNRLDTQIDSVRTEAEKNFDFLTNSIESEGRTLNASIDSLEDKLRQAEAAQRNALMEASSRQDARLSELSDVVQQTAAAIRNEQHEGHTQLSDRLDEAVSALANAKTDRQQLAHLFESIASSLRSDSN